MMEDTTKRIKLIDPATLRQIRKLLVLSHADKKTIRNRYCCSPAGSQGHSFSIIQRLGGSEANSGDIYAAAPKDHSDMTWWTRKFINEESSLM